MQFFLTVGVIVSVIVYGFISYFIASVAYGCYDLMRDSHADYKYDLNWKSRAMSILYACGSIIAVWFIIDTGSILVSAIAEVM